ncbi:MAG: Rab family GTPase [Pseudomonadota bacterium]
MTRLTAKICVLGEFAVGKTSTVARFVHNVFSDKYLTTIGVKIDTKTVMIDDVELKLVVWDVAGTDKLKTVDIAYLKGASGYLLVCDGTRGDTFNAALSLFDQANAKFGDVPHVLLVNKHDLSTSWEVKSADFDGAPIAGNRIFKTSAKNGDRIEEAVHALARQILANEVGGVSS